MIHNYTISIREHSINTGYIRIEVVLSPSGSIIYTSWHKSVSLAMEAAKHAITRHAKS